MRKIAHISDLHFDTEKEIIAAGLIEDIKNVSPDLVVVSGDLTQRARNKQFINARDYLKKLPSPSSLFPEIMISHYLIFLTGLFFPLKGMKSI